MVYLVFRNGADRRFIFNMLCFCASNNLAFPQRTGGRTDRQRSPADTVCFFAVLPCYDGSEYAVPKHRKKLSGFDTFGAAKRADLYSAVCDLIEFIRDQRH